MKPSNAPVWAVIFGLNRALVALYFGQFNLQAISDRLRGLPVIIKIIPVHIDGLTSSLHDVNR